jgi:uncharacterized protein YqhQ
VKPKFDATKPMAVGGQAVLEGVMMRAPGVVATAVRRANGTIELKKEAHRSLGERYPLLKLPILRGAVGLVEMMVIGIRTLNFSAEIATQDSETESGVGSANGAPQKASPPRERLALAATVVLSLTIGVAVFFVTPLAITTWFFDVEQEALWFNMIAGGVRISLLLAYLAAISMIKDIRRLFEYHGAEHKAVFAFEKGEGLTIEACARQSRFHPRCGTSFLLIVMCSAILLFSILDAMLIQQFGQITVLMRIATHLPLIPVVGGISYEFIRTSAKHSETAIGRMVVAPGLWLQKITTREPDTSQLEVAVAALKAALGDTEEQHPASLLIPEGSIS